MLRGAGQARSAAVLGPKVMDWADRRILLEAGVTIDGAGRRVTGIEPREVDQGQHDGDRDVLAVGSAGMLVRRDVWEQLGGFDPAMPLFRDDIDFCWRVHAAGHRVRVITDAVLYHLEAAARNRRLPSAAPRPRRMDRRNALLTLLANLPLGPALAALAGNLVLSTLRTMFFLLVKRPRAALDECAAVGWVLGHPLGVLAARRQRSRGRRAAYGRLRGELPRGRSFRKLAEFAASVFYRSTQIDTAGSHHATDDPSDDDFLLVDNGLTQRILTNPAILLVAGLTVVALAAERSLLDAGTLAGGALTPAWGGASALWQEYLQGFHPAGIGSVSATPPYVAAIAALATVLGGKPWLAIDVIMIGAIPLAGLTAYLAARRITSSVAVRVWAGAAYALLPVGMGAVAAGRFGSALVFVLIPVIGLLAARIFTEPPRRARRAAWATGLVIAVAAAFVPLTWVVAIAAAACAAATLARRNRATLINCGIAVAAPAVLLLPWTVSLLSHPGLLFLEAGQKVPGLAFADLPARSLLLLSPGGPGLPPFWVTGGLAVAALAVLALTTRRFLVLAGWCVALLSLLISVAVSRILITPDGATTPVAAWPGISIAVAAAGLLLAVVVAADTLPGTLSPGQWRRPRGLAVLVLVAAAASAPLLAAGSWVADGVRGPVASSAGPVLPAFVSVSADTGLRLRTLVLRTGAGGVSYEVLRDTDPLLGSADLSQPAAAQRALNAAVAILAAPHGQDAEDLGQALAALDIGYVLLPAPVSGALAGTLNDMAALRPVSRTPAFQLWRVADTAARVRVIEPGGAVHPVPAGPSGVSGVAAPRSGGTLVLAEPAGGWSATLNGTPLQPLAPAGGWAQAFRLPPGGGTLDISHNDLARDLLLALEVLAFLVVAALGLPGTRMPGESRAEPGQRQAGGGRRQRTERAERAEPADQPGLEDVPVLAQPGPVDAPRAGAGLAAAGVAGAGVTGAGLTSAGAGVAGAGLAGDVAGSGRPGRRARAETVAQAGPEPAAGARRPGRRVAAQTGAAPGLDEVAGAGHAAPQDSAAGPQDQGSGRGLRKRWRRGGPAAAPAGVPAPADTGPGSRSSGRAAPGRPPAASPYPADGDRTEAEPYPPRARSARRDEYVGDAAMAGEGHPGPGAPGDERYLASRRSRADYPEPDQYGVAPAGPGRGYAGLGDPDGGDFGGGHPAGDRPESGYPPAATGREDQPPATRRLSRGRLPGDDDVLPPPSRRAAAREGGPGPYPGTAGYRGDPGYPGEAGYGSTADPERARGAGSGGYPGTRGYPEGGTTPRSSGYPGRSSGGSGEHEPAGGYRDSGGYPAPGGARDSGGYPAGGYPGPRAGPARGMPPGQGGHPGPAGPPGDDQLAPLPPSAAPGQPGAGPGRGSYPAAEDHPAPPGYPAAGRYGAAEGYPAAPGHRVPRGYPGQAGYPDPGGYPDPDEVSVAWRTDSAREPGDGEA